MKLTFILVTMAEFSVFVVAEYEKPHRILLAEL